MIFFRIITLNSFIDRFVEKEPDISSIILDNLFKSFSLPTIFKNWLISVSIEVPKSLRQLR